jgi:hypothetical protein
MPEPIAVEPPERSSSIAARIAPFLSIPVGGSTTRELPAYVTSETVSPSLRLLVRMRSERLARSSRSGADIEPETSTRNTRCAGLRSAIDLARVAMPTRRMCLPGDSGDGAASITTANGLSLAGAGNW